jgi:hypothetical protein
MKFISAFSIVTFVLAATSALADSRVFIIANQAAGSGVGECLAKGQKCGAQTALSYCQSQHFAQAASFRRVDPDEVTGSVPAPKAGQCKEGNCDEYVAIICRR